MNYSVFKLQNQAGRPGIFWEKEKIPKNDRKFSYKKKEQRFNLRRYPGDRGYVDTDLVALTPDEAPPPKPAKNFIKRNREKIAPKGKPEGTGTVTLTQEQLNAILRSVGKFAGGHKNAIKVSIDKKPDSNESPRRKKDAYYDDEDNEDYDDRRNGRRRGEDDNEEYDDRREKKRNKKRQDTRDEDSAGGSIYALLANQSKPRNTSDNENYYSDESLHMEPRRKPRKQRKERQPRRKYDDEYDEPESKSQKSRSRKTYNDDDNDDDDNRRRQTRSKSTKKYLSDDEEDTNVPRNRRTRSKPRHYDDEDDELVLLSDKENQRRNRKSTKKRDDSYEDDIEDRDRERTKKRGEKSRKDDHSVEKRDRSEKRDKGRNVSNERDSNVHNTSGSKVDEENVSPRDKIGLPIDLSWRHMSKAERKRLEMARQRVIDEEEKREEGRIRQLQSKYGQASTEPSNPQPKRLITRSDPSSRLDRGEGGRETDLSYRTEHYRRDRRSPSPKERSPERSPDLPDNLGSPKMPVPTKHLSLAERKRLEWEREKVESQVRDRQGDFDPWGRPGAGAPLRTKSGHVAANYRGRQEQMQSTTIEEEPEKEDIQKEYEPHPPSQPKERRRPRHHSPPTQQTPRADTEALPHAMRSSFVLGQAAPDYDKFNDTKEREKKQWLADLERQIEEKKAKEMKIADQDKIADTWADKFGQSHRAPPFPEQVHSHRAAPFQEEPMGAPTPSDRVGVYDAPPIPDSHRASSAPEDGQLDENMTHIRGQNAPIDPVTKRELEDKRRKYLEHQMAVKAQVEEKERLKRVERERKMREDMEEERKLQEERDMLKKQFENEQQKMKQKEAQRQAQVNQLKAAMDEAQAKALQEKYQRRMQHLEAGGHDTKKLREHLEGELTSRIEQLHTRRERDVQRAQQILDLQYWGLEKIDEEGLGQNAKITPRSDPRDPPHTGVISVVPSHVPGLDLSTSRSNHNQYGQTKREPDHDPYVEDRVLTPSRFRHPSKPWSDPSSPRREFGTQTGNENESSNDVTVDDINRLLNTSLPREESEVQIEYRTDKKVRVISAPKESINKRHLEKRPPRSKEQSPHREQPSPHQHHHEVQKRREQIEAERKKRIEEKSRKGPVKPGSRPKWGYKNMENKKIVKNSEKDPFYERKKRESQFRRYQREQKLLAMVEANKEVIPDYYVAPSKSSRSRSRSREPSPYSDFEHESIRETRITRRSKSHSPNRTLRDQRSDYLPVHTNGDTSKPFKSDSHRKKTSRSPPRDRSESPPARQSRSRVKSPPVPAIKHRSDMNQNEARKHAGKYRDPVAVGKDADFVPFMRTVDVLDPLRAEDPMPLSREATEVTNARKLYYESLHPDKFGDKQTFYQDTERTPIDSKNPLINPGMVLEHPTSRQDQILIQLSTLKQSLMQRQRELETFSPSDLEKQDIPVF